MNDIELIHLSNLAKAISYLYDLNSLFTAYFDNRDKLGDYKELLFSALSDEDEEDLKSTYVAVDLPRLETTTKEAIDFVTRIFNALKKINLEETKQ